MADTSNMSQDELNAHNRLVAEALKLAKQEARYRKEVSTSLADYLAGVEKANKMKKTYNANLKIQSKFEKELEKAQQDNDAQAILNAQVKLDLIKKQNKELKKQQEALEDALATVNKTSMVTAKLGAEALKGIAKLATNIPGLITKGYGQIKSAGLFDMDKAIKQSGLSMGLLSKQTSDYRANITAAAKRTTTFGIGIEELAQMQASYSEELGRAVVLTEQESVAMAKIAADAQLSTEAMGQMTAELDRQGVSAERTADYIHKVMEDTHKMGLNSSKVIKNINANFKMLNRYNFKNGVDGLAKMAQTVSKLGVSMEFAAGFADKLWDVEGAVDMSAQLQVLGGEWSKLADPFKLMYQARNDIEGLTEELGKAASASAHLNKKGEIEIAAVEMHKLKIIAQQTGVAYDELAQAGKNAFKLNKIKGQVQFQMSDEEKEFLTNQAHLDKDGKAYIVVKGDKKFLGQLGANAQSIVKAQMEEQKAMGERAKDAQTFDEALNNTINGMKVYLLPIITAINEKLLPKLKDFGDRFENEKWGDKIEKFAGIVGDLVTTIGGFIIDNPIKTGLIYLTTKLGGFLMDKATWFSNGLILAQGFNAGSAGGGAASAVAGGVGKFAKLGKFAKIGGGVIAAGASGYDEWTTNKENGVEAGENAGRTAIRAGGAGLGAWGGAAAGAALGSVVPVIGTVVGGIIGGILGGLAGDKLGDMGGDAAYGVHDGKFPAIGKNLGSDFSQGRGIIQGGKITPIDNKDDLMAMKRGGPVDNALRDGGGSVNTTRVDFGSITINGEILIKSPGSPGMSEDLMKDPSFRRDITRTIQVELEKNKIGGKNKGQ